MAYKLLDQNGNYMEINGMHKGTIVSPYKYHGMELYNDNAIATNRYPFYFSLWGGSRRVRVGNQYYAPSGTAERDVDDAYEVTEIAINGSYSNSSYKDYEVYKDGNLVASGSYTSSNTDIYVCKKEANTSIIVRGIWDEANSKFIYNITTNATIDRNHNYAWDNGIVATSDFVSGTINDQESDTNNNLPRKIEIPSQEEFVYGFIPEDSIIISISNPSFTFTFTYESQSNIDAWLRTSYDTTTINPSTLPGSAVTRVTNLSSSSPKKSSTVNGTTHFGKTYYLYSRPHSSTGGYTGANPFLKVSCVTTAIVKYRYFEEVHTVKVNVTRTNAYTLPSYTLTQVQALLPQYGTSTINNFKYHFTFKNNASSGSYTYFKIKEGSTTKISGSISLGSTKTNLISYSKSMTSTLVLQMSAKSDGTYIDGSDSYISFSKEEGAQYLEIFYTWTPE